MRVDGEQLEFEKTFAVRAGLSKLPVRKDADGDYIDRYTEAYWLGYRLALLNGRALKARTTKLFKKTLSPWLAVNSLTASFRRDRESGFIDERIQSIWTGWIHAPLRISVPPTPVLESSGKHCAFPLTKALQLRIMGLSGAEFSGLSAGRKVRILAEADRIYAEITGQGRYRPRSR